MAIFVTESQVTELLDMPTAIQAVEEVMKLHGEGKAVNHPDFALDGCDSA